MSSLSSIDRNFLDELQEVMGDDLDELLAVFANNAILQFDLMQAAIDGENAETLQKLAHTLKGAAASVGAVGLSQRLLELERRGRNGVFDGARQELSLARQALDDYQRELASWKQVAH